MKTPKLNSAAVVARTISCILKENGFQKAIINRDHFLTEGFHVSRVGYSKTVSVDYHVEGYQPDSDRLRMKSEVDQMREVLFELGYVFSHPHSIYIECLES